MNSTSLIITLGSAKEQKKNRFTFSKIHDIILLTINSAEQALLYFNWYYSSLSATPAITVKQQEELYYFLNHDLAFYKVPVSSVMTWYSRAGLYIFDK